MVLENTHQLQVKATRIVSLVPSQTSLLHYLGLDAEVAGITKFCVHPTKWQKEKKIIGGTKNLRIESIKKLNPDLIIANKEENVKAQIDELAKDYNVWVTDVNTYKEALDMILTIGKLTGKKVEAENLILHIDLLKTQLLPESESNFNKTVAYFIWKDPWMVAASGTYINNLLALGGFSNYFANQQRYPVIELQQLHNAHIDALFLSSEPYPFKEKHLEELQLIFPHTKIELVDGEMFSWYGDFLLKSIPYIHSLKEKINGR